MNILFISHNATRSGAPLYLYHLIKWLTDKKGVKAFILFVDGGEMEREYVFCKKVWIWNAYHTDHRLKSRIAGRVFPTYKRKLYQEKVIFELQEIKPDLIVANTVLSLPILQLIKQRLNVRSVAIIHEMKFSAEYFYPETLSKENFDSADKIIAVNEDIKKYICNEYNSLPAKVSVIPPFISSFKLQPLRVSVEVERITVGFSGYTGWQKGYDLLPPLISLLKSKGLHQYFEFLWLGAVDKSEYSKNEMQLDNIGLSGYVKHVGKVDNMGEWLQKIDLFISLSREDSYPLVCIEAAAAGLPIIAFEKSGGVSDLISQGGGILVPYLNLPKIVEAMEIYRDINRRMTDAASAFERAQYYNIDRIAEKISSFLNI